MPIPAEARPARSLADVVINSKHGVCSRPVCPEGDRARFVSSRDVSSRRRRFHRASKHYNLARLSLPTGYITLLTASPALPRDLLLCQLGRTGHSR
jgi:hypothetical protein